MFPDEIHLMGRLHMFSLRLLKDDLFFFFYTTVDRSVSFDQPNDIGIYLGRSFDLWIQQYTNSEIPFR